ncbi:hypothetical protein BG004_001916 [Podila humilis]|nr:hypothetical protein BG004_001916 [Podila humilis]
MTKPDGSKWSCKIPLAPTHAHAHALAHTTFKKSSEEIEQDEQESVKRGVALLDRLDKKCLRAPNKTAHISTHNLLDLERDHSIDYIHKKKSFRAWTYEFCYNGIVRQYYQAATDEHSQPLPQTPVYLLGQYHSLSPDLDSFGKKRSPVSAKMENKATTQFDTKHDRNYLVQTWGHGDFCAMTTQRRQIRILVAEALDVVLENYAHGSATTDSRIVQGKTGINADLPVPGFIQQIQLFHDTNIQQQIDLADTLFAISFQGNDFWFDPTIDTQVVLGSIERGIRQLIGLGARHFLVLKNSDFGLIPAFGGNSTMAKERSQVSAKLLREYKGMSERLAQEFGQTFVECDEEGSSESDSNNSNNKTKVNIVFYDLLEFLKTLRDPGTLARLHISNTTHGCVSPDYQTGCNDPGEYFFYDSFHPSAKVHRAIGEAVLAFLSEK